MKLIRPHSGPDSYDFRTDGQIVTMAVSCARRTGTGVAAPLRPAAKDTARDRQDENRIGRRGAG